MRLVKELVLRAWEERKAQVGSEAADAERKTKTIQQKLDRLDEAYLYAETIDLTSYERQRDRLRQELTLTQINKRRFSRWPPRLIDNHGWHAPCPVALHDPVKFEPPPPRGPWISDFCTLVLSGVSACWLPVGPLP